MEPADRFRRERMRVAALSRFAEMLRDHHPMSRRAAGGVVCETCGFAYDDHPTVMPALCPTLVVLCDGTLVKL